MIGRKYLVDSNGSFWVDSDGNYLITISDDQRTLGFYRFFVDGDDNFWVNEDGDYFVTPYFGERWEIVADKPNTWMRTEISYYPT